MSPLNHYRKIVFKTITMLLFDYFYFIYDIRPANLPYKRYHKWSILETNMSVLLWKVQCEKKQCFLSLKHTINRGFIHIYRCFKIKNYFTVFHNPSQSYQSGKKVGNQ